MSAPARRVGSTNGLTSAFPQDHFLPLAVGRFPYRATNAPPPSKSVGWCRATNSPTNANQRSSQLVFPIGIDTRSQNLLVLFRPLSFFL